MPESSAMASITVVLDEAVEQWIKSALDSSGTLKDQALTAGYVPDEFLVRVRLAPIGPHEIAPHGQTPVSCHWVGAVADEIPGYPIDAGGSPALVFSKEDNTRELVAYFYPQPDAAAIRCDVDVVRIEADLFSRVTGIFDSTILAPKTVGVVGLGSGGSVCALEMAKCGVGNFILVDFDRLKSHNLSRHICGLADVGRFKTRAVRDSILQHNPNAVVRCHEIDICDEPDLMERIISECDLMLVATDTELSKYLLNESCLALGKPAIYGGAYERAFAGEVIRVIPGQGGCYLCVRQDLSETIRSISTAQEFDYTDDTVFQAEPGLGLDVSSIALVQTRFALMTLLRESGSTLGDIDAEMIIWTNWARPQDGELFERPMMSHYLRVAKSDDCPSCGMDVQDQMEGGTT